MGIIKKINIHIRKYDAFNRDIAKEVNQLRYALNKTMDKCNELVNEINNIKGLSAGSQDE